MLQFSLIALYGNKADALSSFITSCRRVVSSAFGDVFKPYDLRQVHATLVGLESVHDSRLHNANFQRLRERRVQMDIPGFLAWLRTSAELPLRIQIGGFAEQDLPFLSRGDTPYRRAFSIQGDKAVVMGWPCGDGTGRRPGDYPLTLDAIRRGAQRFGILHRYHVAESDLDNDFFLRIGLIELGTVSDEVVRGAEERMRRLMSRQPPLILNIGLGDLRVAAYRDDTLPLESTRLWSLSDARLEEGMGETKQLS